MNAVENQVRELVKVELAAANEKFPPFHSAHEGWAVLKEEVEELEKMGAKVVTLGNRILRTETAPIVITSNIIYELENEIWGN